MSCTKKNFDIIAISETRIIKQVSLLNNLNLNNYSFEFTPADTSAGGTLLYIANHLSYKCRGVSQGSVLGPLLFLFYINVLNQAIKFCKVHHFADDTNLICLGNFIKKLNKLVNTDLTRLVNWLNANKILVNVKKTEMAILKSKQKKFEGDLKIKLSGKRLYPTESVKCLGVKIDTNLSWQYHVNDLSVKLNRANALLFKMRKYVSCKILRSIYFAIFDSYLSYCCLVWAQNCRTIQRTVILQKRLLELLIFNQGILIPVTYSNKALS